MFLKFKAKRAVRKIINGASAKEIKGAVNSVAKEASKQLSRRISRMEYRIPLKVKLGI